MLFSRHSTWSKKSAVINPNKAPSRWLPFEELLQCFYASHPIFMIDKSCRFLLWIEVKSLALIHWFFCMNFLDSAVVYGVEVLWIYSGYVKLDLFSCSLFQSQEISKFLAMQWDQILAAQSCVQTKQSQYWHCIGSALTRKDLIYHSVHYISCGIHKQREM